MTIQEAYAQACREIKEGQDIISLTFNILSSISYTPLTIQQRQMAKVVLYPVLYSGKQNV